jgi:hypothetical protein
VKDESGKRIKDLPKPGKTDDAEKSTAALETWKALKKDIKTLASQQLTRLELAMCARRRWTGADFRLFLADHPLLGHVVKRLVWGLYDGEDRITGAFRVAEDRSLADAEDNAFELAPEARVGIAHPLELPRKLAEAFGQILSDYEILQPFPQLGRESYALSEAEQKGSTLGRAQGAKVATGKAFGLEQKGWRRGEPQDAGWIGWITKPLTEDLEAVLELDPGTVVGDLNWEPEQTLGEVFLRRRNSWDRKDLRSFSQLDPVLASELIRDLENLKG